MFEISVRANVKAITHDLDNLAYRQLPFATALALTGLGKRIADDERRQMLRVFDNPTPFTLGAVGTRGATKSDPVAVVFVRDIAAQYLAPFQFGGAHFLGGKRGLLVPKNISVNQYGNLPRGALQRLKGRRDVFIGAVKLKSGVTVHGVWQRPLRGRRSNGGYGNKGPLKLLVRFSDPLEVKQRLEWFSRAKTTVDRWFQAEFAAAMRKAIATAR